MRRKRVYVGRGKLVFDRIGYASALSGTFGFSAQPTFYTYVEHGLMHSIVHRSNKNL